MVIISKCFGECENVLVSIAANLICALLLDMGWASGLCFMGFIE